MKRHTTSTFILLVVLAGSAGPTASMCLDPGPPRLVDAEVVACENPRAAAEKRFRESTEMHRLPGPALKEILAGRPAQLLTLRVVRTQQLSADPRSEEGITREPWAAVEKPEEKQFLLLGAKGCDDLKAGTRKVFLEEFTCCDVLPPQDVACLLQLPALVEPSESLGTTDTH